MARDTYVTKNIRRTDPAVRQAVVSEAKRRGVTLSDVVGEALAEAWDMEYEPSGERTMGIMPHATQLNVRIPQEMAARVWLVARTRGITEGSLVQEVLAERFDIEYEPTVRGGATRRRSKSRV